MSASSKPWSQSRLALLWLIPVAASAYFAGKVTNWGRDIRNTQVDLPAVNTKHVDAGILPDFNLSSDASPYAEIVNRPLFAPWRRPTPPAPPPVNVEPPKPQIRRNVYALTGITVYGDKKFASVRELASGRTRIVRENDELQEYKVAKIDVDRVLLTYVGEKEELILSRFTASGRVTPPPPPPIPAPPPPVAQAAPPPQIDPAAQQAQAAAVPPVPGAPLPPGSSAAGNATREALERMRAQQANPAPAATPAAPTPVASSTSAATPDPGSISVGELLERRRRARQQGGN